MKQMIFAVYDSAVGTYMQPFFMQSKGQAIRAWLDTTNDPKTQFHAHPGDFTLFHLGNYDETTGTFENNLTPVSCGTALEMKNLPVPNAASIRKNLESIKNESTVQ